MFINDSVIIIGLDYYLGEQASYRPDNPVYINKRYKPESILPLSAIWISTKYNKSDLLDKSLLAEMIYYGKSFYFAKQMLPCMPDSLIIGYSPEEMEGCENHQKRIWTHFVENELFYEQSHFEKNKYVGERPKVFEIGNKCPGRVGRWLGWKIVNAYMKNNPSITLKQLMNEQDVKKIMAKSNYKPSI